MTTDERPTTQPPEPPRDGDFRGQASRAGAPFSIDMSPDEILDRLFGAPPSVR